MNLENLVGQVVEIKFLDHASGDGEIDVVECILLGKIEDVDETRVIVNSWICEYEDKDNYDSYAILRSAIVSVIHWVEGVKVC